MEELSVYFGQKEYEGRKATVYRTEDGKYLVKAVIQKNIPMYDHSLYYAEDAAENFVLGVVNI
ncbi:MAG: hypothetical protein VW496_06370 [Pelagibacteraceae bacterium]